MFGIKTKIKKIIEEKKERDTDYYIIRRNDSRVGLCSMFISNLGAIDYLKKNNKIFLFGESDGVEWNQLFKLKNIPITDSKMTGAYFDRVVSFRPNDSMDFFLNKRLIGYWHALYKENLLFTTDVEQFITEKFEEYLKDKKEKTIGVLCRGTDYLSLHPREHPRQPQPRDLFPYIDRLLASGYEYIFLATEDNTILDCFYEKYYDILISMPQNRIQLMESEYLSHAVKRLQINTFIRNRDYLACIYLLSQCNALVGGRTSGTVTAMIMADGYKDVFLWNDGRYGDELENEIQDM